jgi:hypothetical protein
VHLDDTACGPKKQGGIGIRLRSGGATKERAHVEDSIKADGEPPSSGQVAGVIAPRLFECGTARYWAFVEALVRGLIEYEAGRQGGGNGGESPTPVPAA